MKPGEAIKALFDGWEKSDPDAVADLFTSDGIYEDPLQPKHLVGPDEIRQGCGTGIAAITDCQIKTLHFLESLELGFAEGFFASKDVNSGERFDFPFALLVEMREGKIARLAEYFDTKPLIPQG
jgi:ketosteroid isomerase-like protein